MCDNSGTELKSSKGPQEFHLAGDPRCQHHPPQNGPQLPLVCPIFRPTIPSSQPTLEHPHVSGKYFLGIFMQLVDISLTWEATQ